MEGTLFIRRDRFTLTRSIISGLPTLSMCIFTGKEIGENVVGSHEGIGECNLTIISLPRTHRASPSNGEA